MKKLNDHKNPQNIIAQLTWFKFKFLNNYPKILDRIVRPLFQKKVTVKRGVVADYAYVTICNRKSFGMVLASLTSLYKNSKFLPQKIYIVSDGSWKTGEAAPFFRRYGLDVIAVDWSVCARFYKDSCPELYTWAEKQIWGKKMAAILYFSELQGVLFSDPDILWYDSPVSDVDLEKITYKVSVDNSHNYDNDCIAALCLEGLYAREPINCGAVFLKGGLKVLNEESLKCIQFECENPGSFAEQTVFAALDLTYDCRWKMSEVFSEIYDVYNIFSLKKTLPTKGLVARHYLWLLKWNYWHDYFRLLLK